MDAPALFRTSPEAAAGAPVTGRRALSLWLPEAAADLALRRSAGLAGAPLVILADRKGARVVVGLSDAARAAGLAHGLSAADARARAPALVSRPYDAAAMRRLGDHLRRWAERYSPWVGPAERDETAADLGLTLDVTGCGHLFGGEAALLDDLLARLDRMGFRARAAIAGTKGAAFALARYGSDAAEPRIASPGALRAALGDLPPAALRLDAATVQALARLGLRRIEDVAAIPRAALARRFGAPLGRRLDQAFGVEPEPIAPPPTPFRAALRLAFPEPIGLLDDLRAGLARLLERLVARLETHGLGARRLGLELRRVDGSDQRLEIGLVAPSRDADQMLRLFERGLESVEAGYGIDAMRLVALEAERRAETQTRAFADASAAARLGAAGDPTLAELLSRIGGRLGFERVLAYAPTESHLPEKGFHLRPAASPPPAPADWRRAAAARPPRPVIGFAPEPITPLAQGTPRRPPDAFRWRDATHRTVAAFGPERIAPEWWLDDPAWRSGPRDYWRVETTAGVRLWLFRLAQPEEETWFATGRFA